ncbi:putative exodeoxyribonuclease VIII [Pseudescherichia vulneris NBRC 102420]|uniref:Putative exodeoxyribonuclease VIII n=1 Tax=Pseudescherichia vulneris NBRC 102420 TaxID=1115515 RepID=A0A090V851_PSEVU|nr:RecE family exodeoxyribonuclease [Pseudescherichia vulneris]GAL60343.1 putative exodeoxyribonuclease VIII [Pseudescherichia vulneris NBRC 102420]STQ59709.1 putative phage exodeoxyribonuclease [Pseudescherichia vulneris]
MNTYAFVIKAKAKSEKKNLFCWLSAKSDSRAEREILNILDDADIAIGRGADYQLPQRTNWHVADDLPEEGILDDTWCDRYTLGEDGRSWCPVLGEAGGTATPVVNVEAQPTQPAAADADLRPLSRLRLIQRLLAHLMHDTELDQITLEQHIEIGVMEGNDDDCFVQALRQVIEDNPEIRELSAHVEWKLIKAVKAVFPQDQSHESKRIAHFVKDWVLAEASERAQLVEDWLSGELPAPQNNATSMPVESAGSVDLEDENDFGKDDGWTSIRELSLPQQIAAAWMFDQQHIDRQQLNEVKEAVHADNSETLNIVVAALTDPAVVNLTGGVTAGVIRAIRQVWPEDYRDNMTADLVSQFACVYATSSEDGRTNIVQSWIETQQAPAAETGTTDTGITTHQNYSYDQRVLGIWLFGLFSELSAEQKAEITRISLNMDATYPQNVLLACRNHDLRQLQHVFPETLADLFTDVQSVWPVEGPAPQLAQLVSFFKEWIDAHNSNSSITATGRKIDRDGVTAKWLKKAGKTPIQRTDTGANAGGGNPTDRNPDLKHTLDTLDIEIAAALLPMDYNIYEIPGGVLRRAKEIIANKEEPWSSWSTQLRKTPGILDFSRAAVFVLIRNAPEGIHNETPKLISYIAQNGKEVAFIPDTGKPDSEERWQAVESLLITPAAAPVKENTSAGEATQPEVKSLGSGMFSIEGLLATPSNEVAKQEAESVVHVQMEETDPSESQAGAALPAVESVDAAAAQAGSVNPADILAAAAPSLAHHDQNEVNQNPKNVHQNGASVNQNTPEAHQNAVKVNQDAPEAQLDEPAAAYPAYFEPGRYEGLPNDVYHAANGISSTMVKDARVSLMYFEARHVSKTIARERSKVLDMGNLVHALALQPETLAAEFSIEPEIPEGALTTTATIRACIDEYNASLPPQLSADDIKALLEEYNATLPAPLPLGAAVDETAESYMALPEEFQRIEPDKKQTAAAMKACIKEYNATLPAPVKTTGSRDALLEQLAIVNPDLVAQEAQKPAPLKVSGTKADMIQALKAVRPEAVFADELLDAWRENPEGKVLVTRQQLETALAIQKALLAHPTSGMLLTHPSRAVETSYFGIDEETGLEIRVRPDLEIELDGVRIGADLKTISMWDVKADALKARLRREIRMRDYHLSAAMYCETAALDQFYWIFVNKDENYHWIAIIEASAELLELGMLEYRKTMRAIATGFDTGEWPAPITDDYTDELDDFDLRRLEALRTQA